MILVSLDYCPRLAHSSRQSRSTIIYFEDDLVVHDLFFLRKFGWRTVRSKLCVAPIAMNWLHMIVPLVCSSMGRVTMRPFSWHQPKDALLPAGWGQDQLFLIVPVTLIGFCSDKNQLIQLARDSFAQDGL